MITFKITKQNFKPNTFITRKDCPISKTLNKFGYIKSISKDKAIVLWYDNYIKSELTFKLKELINYKSIYPYYNTKFVRGNIWKHSYLTLLRSIHSETGFSNIKVDKMVYKKPAYKGMNVVISDAVYVLSNNITKLEGKIIKDGKHEYIIRTVEGEFTMCRTSFLVLPQDYFILLSIRC